MMDISGGGEGSGEGRGGEGSVGVWNGEPSGGCSLLAFQTSRVIFS